jgi:osmotically-inducible protein OsmY
MTFSSRIRVNAAVAAAAVAGALIASTGVQAQRLGEKQTILSLQRALERLPQYGVFDFLAFALERGVVTLSGYSYTGQLKTDAERAARRVSGVDEVANRLEVLPASLNDDRIRRDAFYRIYTDSFLSRYTSGGPRAVLWEAYEFGRFPGRQPFGNYPIRIIVRGGRITLAGAVDSASDRQLAEFRAREVIGTFGVTNELIVQR